MHNIPILKKLHLGHWDLEFFRTVKLHFLLSLIIYIFKEGLIYRYFILLAYYHCPRKWIFGREWLIVIQMRI